MKILKQITIVTFVVFLSSIAASAQARSIKSVAEDAVFHSEEDGFEISLPANMVQKQTLKEPGKNGRGYMWEFSDAIVAVGVETRPKAVKTDADIAAVITAYKADALKGDKILSESNASIGEYRGRSFVVEKDGNKDLIIVLAWEKFVVTLVGANLSKSPETQKLVLEAVQSFSFVE